MEFSTRSVPRCYKQVQLSDERMGLSVMNGLRLCQASVSHIYRSFLLEILPCALYKLHCQYRLCKADHIYLTYLMLQLQLSHLGFRKLDLCQVQAFYISMLSFALSYAANMFILVILHNFCFLLAPFCYIILYIRNVESPVRIAGKFG
jgi:hypothetical protein